MSKYRSEWWTRRHGPGTQTGAARRPPPLQVLTRWCRVGSAHRNGLADGSRRSDTLVLEDREGEDEQSHADHEGDDADPQHDRADEPERVRGQKGCTEGVSLEQGAAKCRVRGLLRGVSGGAHHATKSGVVALLSLIHI